MFASRENLSEFRDRYGAQGTYLEKRMRVVIVSRVCMVLHPKLGTKSGSDQDVRDVAKVVVAIWRVYPGNSMAP